ncbi:radical SAM family heme chaperone HemW [Candidatus Fukatsuia anoeciicola]|uniref:radical SAM family heme chaperone HemW n=1 Tax=Candidatus Fukatsuia anoeciicola TaxID=2994492 RepID=UPI0034645854
MIQLPLISLYIHIPWCIQKCPYCDFNSHILKGKIPHEEYVKHLLADLDADIPLVNGREISTIFIGGGTPNLLSAEAIQQLLQGIRERLPLVKYAEITMEINPGVIESDYFSHYKHAGVNRISVGVQSFDNRKLMQIGRMHNSNEAKQTAILVKMLQLRSFNLDLMYGLPNQIFLEAIEDLYKTIILNPSHISWYQLTIEPNTNFNSHPPILPDEDTLWEIFQQGHYILSNAGYQQYEISAYAKPGHKCQHNLNYWRFGDYLGIGCGAHSKITFNDSQILRIIKTKYPRKFMQGKYKNQQYNVKKTERPFEFFMNRFRLLERIPRIDFCNLTGLTESTIRFPIEQAIVKGYLEETNKYWQITEKGKLFLNSLLDLFLL